MEFAIINFTDNEAFNIYFSYPIWTMIISLPFIPVFTLIKKIF
jgi:hypothetical protein